MENIREAYRKQRYHFVGKFAVVKPCIWVKKALNSNGRIYCYKEKFYGIPTHRCLQMSPTIFCNEECIFCWRAHLRELGSKIEITGKFESDNPELIVENSLREWRAILSGYKTNPNVSKEILEEAMRPIHAAISLVGEPTLYPYLGELIESFYKHGFKTVFVVTNGTRPDILEKLDPLPSQLYVSVVGPNKNIFNRTAMPLILDAWDRLMKTLSLLNTLSIPTVMRITLVKGLNMTDIDGYAKLIKMAQPTYVEPKAAMDIGWFRKRLPRSAMPSSEDIRKFAKKLAEKTGYKIIDESYPSRIVLLSKLDKPIKLIKWSEASKVAPPPT
ncbi:MAG: 4-demethylwyosine synthase TYW1 [Thermoprotei archaeon]|nr:MAG: 4-demethylwyosine synthase TYW1 [Thermoprotei archaeon]RLE69565.1 MAG: 4-demethylwyosine synthase TYW1 [Thermoprotei archaeon]